MKCVQCLTPFNFGPSLGGDEEAQIPDGSAKKQMRVLVTGGKMSKASWVLRMLGKAGHDVWIGEVATYRFNHTRFSRFCRGYEVLPRPEADMGAWLCTLRRLIIKHRIDLLIPCTSPVESKFYAQLYNKDL